MPDDAVDRTEGAVEMWAAPEGGFCARDRATGTTFQGATETEALANLTEATELFREVFAGETGQTGS